MKQEKNSNGQKKKSTKYDHEGLFKKGDGRAGAYATVGGRPKGSRNKLSMAMLEDSIEKVKELMEDLFKLAKQGDTTAMRIFLDKMVPNAKEKPIQVEIPIIATMDDVVIAHNKLLECIQGGKVTPSEADSVLNQIEWRRKMFETQAIQALRLELDEAKAELKKYIGDSGNG